MSSVTLAGIVQLVIVALGGYLFNHYLTFKKRFFLGMLVVVLTPLVQMFVGHIFSPGDTMPNYLFAITIVFGVFVRYIQSLIFKNRQLEKGAPANEGTK